MSGRRIAAPVDHSLCRRCQIHEPVITVRSDPLCNPCFCKYVTTKVLKRMEAFRVRYSNANESRMLLLPLSFGAASTVLLQILTQQLRWQAERSGRTGFSLHVLHVSEYDDSESERLATVRDRYPEHTYSTVPLSDALSGSTAELAYYAQTGHDHGELTSSQKLEHFLESLSSPTSRMDVLQILKRKCAVQFAKKQGCEAILWGDSTTRLAERTIAETAKGRGFSLPWIVADAKSPNGIPFYFPLSEIMSKELVAYASLVEPSLDQIICQDPITPAVSTKNTTIDNLMKQYFESVERDFPSIVANVVRTGGKLKPTPLSEIEAHCELCEMPLAGEAPEKSRLCYGCIRTLSRGAT